MAFNSQDFHDTLDQDIFIIQQLLQLPEDPAPTITTLADGTIQMNLADSIGLSYEIEAIKEYRKRTLPLIFIITQKVYAELFRLMLGHSNTFPGPRQFDIETAVGSALNSNSLAVYSPFLDQSEFNRYWNGQNNFIILRKARNQVVHKAYSFSNSILVVNDDNGQHLLTQTETNILDFANEILVVANRV